MKCLKYFIDINAFRSEAEWNISYVLTGINKILVKMCMNLQCCFFSYLQSIPPGWYFSSDSDQSLQVVDACDLCLSYWQFSNHFNDWSQSTSCSSLTLQVNCALRDWQKLNKLYIIVRFEVVLTCVDNLICVNVRLLSMRV